MKTVLLLTNSEVSTTLELWLRPRSKLHVFSDKIELADIESIRPEVVISYSYRFIIGPEVLAFQSAFFINLHISLLPFNRGADPNIWSFLEDTPKGVTIHEIDKGLDTGKIIAQREITFNDESETLKSSYEKLHIEIQQLFIRNWSGIEAGSCTLRQQELGGSYHRASEIDFIREDLLKNEGWSLPVNKLKTRYSELIRKN